MSSTSEQPCRTLINRSMVFCSTFVMAILLVGQNVSDAAADEFTDDGGSAQFSWSTHRTSVADLVIGRELEFRHGTLDLTPQEHNSYADLLRTIQERRFSATTDGQSAADSRNLWETAFYQYEHVRRQAYQNGTLSNAPVVGNALSDPFSTTPGASADPIGTSPMTLPRFSDRGYSLVQDMAAHPADFVGRPVVIYGRFSPSGSVEIIPIGRFEWEPEQLQFQRGILRGLSGDQTIALVDTSGYIDHRHQTQIQPISTAGQGASVPVMIKGWFVKLWGQQPLIYTEAIRILGPEPYSELIREFTVSGDRLAEQEKWLYYETLRQMQLTSSDVQRDVASVLRAKRIVALKDEVVTHQVVQTEILQAQLKSQKLSNEEFQSQKTRLDRQIASRLKRYHRIQEDPNSFPAFVDLCLHPQHWQGKLMTLSGHVRHCVTYNGDSALMAGQTLHELWIFTDDSQHNPAVIISTSLPEGFPCSADVIDRVTVTGCFFKMYVYTGQEKRRPAPLILAGQVNWDPTDDQVRSLAAAGHLPATDSRVLAVQSRSDRTLSDAAVLLCGFAAIVVMMTIWGRVQRDRHERRRLLDLVDEQPDFHQTESLV